MDFVSLRAGCFLACLGAVGCNRTNSNADRALPTATSQTAAVKTNGAPAVSATAVKSSEIAQASHHEPLPPLETTWIAEDCFAALIFHPRQILRKQPLQGESRAWLEAAATDLGLRLASVEQIAFLLAPPEPGAPAGSPAAATWIFRFSAPDGQQAMVRKFLSGNSYRQVAHAGRVYYRDREAPMALCAPDERTVLLATERNLKKTLTLLHPHSLLLANLTAIEGRPDVVAALDPAPLRPLLRRAAGEEEAGQDAPPLSPWARQISEAVSDLKEATLTVDLAEDPVARLKLEADDSQGAIHLEELAQGYRATASVLLGALRAQWERGEEGPEFAPFFALLGEMLAGVSTKRDVRQVVVEAPAPKALARLPGILESAFAAAVRGGVRQERVRRLQLVGLAMHNHHVVQGSFPPAMSRDPAGRPLLSWRVHLLPHLGEAELYRKFRLDQPWDSPHNLALLDQMPLIYSTPGAKADGKTRWMAMIGPGAPLALARGVPLSDFTDGPDNTILVVECGSDRAVPWTQPEDLAFDPAHPVAALGEIDREGFLALYGDGRVEIIQSKIAPAALLALLTHAGGEPSEPIK